MIDRNKESLSALMDGEADELEVRRILNHLDKDDELRENWKNYHLMGSLMRDESFDSLDLTAGINKALDGIDLDGAIEPNRIESISAEASKAELIAVARDESATASPAWYRPLTSVAVAASVTLAVLLGVQSIEPDNGMAVATANNASAQAAGELTASTVSQEQHQLSTQEQQKDLESAQQRLQDYVLKQSQGTDAGDAGVLPFARVVEFEGQGQSK